MLDKIPVIIDTDIGDYIDDMWALYFALKSPELDVKLITTCTEDTTYRNKFVAKILDMANRTDIPIATGIKYPAGKEYQHDWVKDFDLASYSGKIYHNGVQAIIDTIKQSTQPITLICLGPLPNIAAVLKKEPTIVNKVKFIGMHGSIRKGYNGKPEPEPELNVELHTEDCQYVFTSDLDMTITPLDTCGLVKLDGSFFQELQRSSNPVIQEFLDCNRAWIQMAPFSEVGNLNPDKETTVLFDTVAIYLGFTDEFLTMKKIPLKVTDEGMTVIDEQGKIINCALEWKDLNAFKKLVVKRLA